MARTNEAAVGLAIHTSLTSPQVDAFIDDANVWVTAYLGAEGLAEAILERIERYLACALIRTRELGIKSGSFEGVQESYQVDPEVTDYLKRAAGFDPTGNVREHFLAPANRTQFEFRTGTGYVP